MKILSAQQIRDWDQFTMQEEPISSINLMERAASRCVEWIMINYPDADSFSIYCGKGNNGGDGLAIARMLLDRSYKVSVFILEFGHKGTADFQANLARLHQLPNATISFVQDADHFHPIPKNEVVIDALFGSGLNRGLEGVTAALVQHMNNSGAEIVSIDIPSGLFTDRSSRGNITIHATHTLSFQCYKPAFLYAENEEAFGIIHILEIGLHPGYYDTIHTRDELIDSPLIHSIYKPRKNFSHKGNYGHALLLAGSYGKIGAAVLAARGCLASGIGLLSCQVPTCGYEIMQIAVPEAMTLTGKDKQTLSKPADSDLSRYAAIGIGPGIGTSSDTKMFLRDVLDAYRSPVVLDADALNIISTQKDILKLVPPGSILTPHPKEFERLFGTTANDFERAKLAQAKAEELQSIIVLKGHHSLIASPGGIGQPAHETGKGFYNATGNPGMATGGSGDVLTGILTGLLGQGYSAVESAILGVYLHGLAGDYAARKYSMEAMVAGNIIDCMGQAFQSIN